MQKILIFGAGRVSGPCVDYLVRKTDFKITVADISEESLGAIKRTFPSVETVCDDTSRNAAALIDAHSPDLVVNLMPPELMYPISKLCLEKKRHMVHPAYLDDATRALDADVKASGLVFIPEMGVDPGIDHMSATRTIREIKSAGGKVVSFRSICGALPAADANTNPWGYKLSWSPSSLIGASKRTARIIENGQETIWPDGVTYEHVYLEEIEGLGAFEVYANADSTAYKEIYEIPDATELYRGTMRYPGWCETICHMNALGFFELDEMDLKGLTFAAFTAKLAGTTGNPKEALCRALKIEPWTTFILRMQWMGFFNDRAIPMDRGSARDVVTFLFGEKMVFTKEERDLIILRDECLATFADGKKRRYRSTLIDLGTPGGFSSIAKTTGLPPAIAARFILEGKISTPGVHVPVTAEIVDPVLKELETEGVKFEESILEI